MFDPAFTWWRSALAGKPAPIHEGDPQPGFYRVRRKGRDGHSPVAFWRDSKNGELRCHMDGADYDPQKAIEIWIFAAKSPVTSQAYGERLRTGKWPDESAAVVGHNASPPADTLEVIADRLDDLAREANRLIIGGVATSSEICDQASDLANTFGELEAKADKLRAAEKAPALEECRAVDSKWKPVIDRAGELKKWLKQLVITPFLRAREQQAVAAPELRTVAGSSKRTTALRTQRAAEVMDWTALITALVDHPDIRETAQRIANASARNGVSLPGMRITEERTAA